MPIDLKELTLKDIEEWFKTKVDDKDAKKYLSDYALEFIKTEDGITFLLSDAGKPLYKKETDRVASKAIDTFKEKTMPGLITEQVDAKVKELNPEETPEQKRIREQDERIKKLEKQGKKDRLSKVVVTKLSAAKFNPLVDLSDRLIGDDEEQTLANIMMLETGINAIVEAAIKEKLTPREPGHKITDGDPDFKDPFSDEHWNVTEQMELYTANNELYKQLRKKAVARGKLTE